MIGWELVYDGYEPALEGVRETLCTVAMSNFLLVKTARRSS